MTTSNRVSMRRILAAAILVVVYVAIGQIVTYIRNPMVPGAIIALNMVVIVIAGILFGPLTGALVGLLGTAFNGFLTPAGSPFERAAVFSHAVMGALAGVGARRSVLTGALTIIVGHALNVVIFISTRLLPIQTISAALFFSGLLFEIVVDVVVILFAVPLLRAFMGPDVIRSQMEP